jgi:outer membrane biosynthesis protein TonB
VSTVSLTAPAPSAGHAKAERLRDEIIAISRSLDALEQKRDTLDAQLTARESDRRHYALLGTILQSLDELEREGAGDLFWHHQQTGLSESAQRAQLQSAREQLVAFDSEINALQAQRDSLQVAIDQDTLKLQGLNGGLADLEDELEAQRADFDAWRDPSEVPFKPLTMPWSSDKDEEKRYRKIMFVSLAFGLLFGSLVIVFKPGERAKQEEFIPEHIAELVVKKKEEPKPQPKKEPPKESELRPDQQRVASNVPADSVKAAARASAQTKGVLAFSDSFADLASDDVNIGGLGDAPVSNAGRQANGGAPGSGAAGSRALITSATGTGSGGIANAGISRGGIGSGSGNSISGSGVATTVASSGIATAARAAARPAGGGGSGGSGSGGRPTRTDEDIQIVFDKYKAALYRIYNRELRNDPTLRGKVVLALTIEPDGSVSACRVQSTDLNSPALVAEIVERVKKFNFGAKEGVPQMKILYGPIDFLPAG